MHEPLILLFYLFLGFLAQTVFLMAAAFLMTPTGTISCIIIAVALGAFAWCGFAYVRFSFVTESLFKKIFLFYRVNHLDIAPQHASVLMGISNTFATIPGIVSPALTGYLVTNSVGNRILTFKKFVFSTF